MLSWIPAQMAFGNGYKSQDGRFLIYKKGVLWHVYDIKTITATRFNTMQGAMDMADLWANRVQYYKERQIRF